MIWIALHQNVLTVNIKYYNYVLSVFRFSRSATFCFTFGSIVQVTDMKIPKCLMDFYTIRVKNLWTVKYHLTLFKLQSRFSLIFLHDGHKTFCMYSCIMYFIKYLMSTIKMFANREQYICIFFFNRNLTNVLQNFLQFNFNFQTIPVWTF